MVYKTTMYEILAKVEAAPSHAEKINVLRQNDSHQLRHVLQSCFDARIIWLLPEGPVPFKPLIGDNAEKIFWAECRKLYLFVRGGNNNLKQIRRESLFIQMLEAIDVKDANLLVTIKDKRLPFPSITHELIVEAWNVDWPKYNPVTAGSVELNAPKPQLNIAPDWTDAPPPAVVHNEENNKAVETIIKEAFRDSEEEKLKHKKKIRKMAADKRREKARAEKLAAKELKGVENTEA